MRVTLFLAVLGFHYCLWAFSSCSKWDLLFLAMHRLLIPVASLVVEHRLQAAGLVVVAHRLTCPWRVESSRSRDWTCVPCTGSWPPNHWTTREVPDTSDSERGAPNVCAGATDLSARPPPDECKAILHDLAGQAPACFCSHIYSLPLLRATLLCSGQDTLPFPTPPTPPGFCVSLGTWVIKCEDIRPGYWWPGNWAQPCMSCAAWLWAHHMSSLSLVFFNYEGE